MTKYLLHQADLTRLPVEVRGKGVAQDMALLDYLRTPQTDPHDLDWLHLPESITSR